MSSLVPNNEGEGGGAANVENGPFFSGLASGGVGCDGAVERGSGVMMMGHRGSVFGGSPYNHMQDLSMMNSGGGGPVGPCSIMSRGSSTGGPWGGGGPGVMPQSFRGDSGDDGNNAGMHQHFPSRQDQQQQQQQQPVGMREDPSKPLSNNCGNSYTNYSNRAGCGGGAGNTNNNDGNNLMGMSNFQDDDERINYLAARAHAAQMLAAEESRRLEENLMRLEMRRMMMGGGRGGDSRGGGGGGPGGIGMMDVVGGNGGGENQQQGGGGYQQAYNSQFQHNNNNPSSSVGMNSDDFNLMARAQKFSSNMPQHNQMMTDRNIGMNQSMGAGYNWDVGNTGLYANNFSLIPNNSGTLNPTHVAGKVNNGEGVVTKSRSGDNATAQGGESAEPKPIKSRVEAPRRPLSAYNIFFSEMREVILKENNDDKNEEEGVNYEKATGLSAEEESDKAHAACAEGAEYGENDSDTKPNGDRIKGGEQQPDKDMKAFTQSLMKKRLNKAQKKRAHRKSHGKVAFTALAKTVGQKWRELPEDEKKKYKGLAEIDRARYRKEKAAIGKILREEAKKQRREAKEQARAVAQQKARA